MIEYTTNPIILNQIGLSGEYLAASVLQRHFKTIAFANHNSSYDLILEQLNGGFLKCQVKTTSTADKNKDYRFFRWNLDKSRHKKYAFQDFHFVAFVVLPLRLCCFKLNDEIKGQTHRISVSDFNADLEKKSIQNILGVFNE
tara:strand:+ start:701 stop:1126 length:426 start_codon:yes stop_codon:yes gene_type:complete